MATVTAGSRKRTRAPSGFVFYDVSWDDYEAMLRIVGDRPIRVIYDQGTMEIFMPSFVPDNDAYYLGRMVDLLTEELEISVRGGRTTTHKRQDLGKGAEPDDCYWFGPKARRMAGKRQLDLSRDPAPDLVVEVDVTRTSLDRLKIFAALGGPGGLALHQPIAPVSPSSGRWDLSTTANQPELPRLDRFIGRSVPQRGANRRLHGLDPVFPGLYPREDHPGPATERTVIARTSDRPGSRPKGIRIGGVGRAVRPEGLQV
jgi:hypothetical protein